MWTSKKNRVIYGGELFHHGVKGQKWGVRNYQNPDGSLTPSGKARYSWEGKSRSEIAKRLYKDKLDSNDAFHKMKQRQNAEQEALFNKVGSMSDSKWIKLANQQEHRFAREDSIISKQREAEKSAIREKVFGGEEIKKHFDDYHNLAKEEEKAFKSREWGKLQKIRDQMEQKCDDIVKSTLQSGNKKVSDLSEETLYEGYNQVQEYYNELLERKAF